MSIIVLFNVAFWDEKKRRRGGFLRRETCFQAFAALNWLAIAKVAIYFIFFSTKLCPSHRGGPAPTRSPAGSLMKAGGHLTPCDGQLCVLSLQPPQMERGVIGLLLALPRLIL